jgi:hypothetical protein
VTSAAPQPASAGRMATPERAGGRCCLAHSPLPSMARGSTAMSMMRWLGAALSASVQVCCVTTCHG